MLDQEPKATAGVQIVDQISTSLSTPERRLSSEKDTTALPSSQVVDSFKPNAVFYALMSMLAILTLVVALDATALAVALPV